MKKQDHRYVLEHYLEILERKPRAAEQAIPVKRGIMPEECREFLRLCREPDAKQQLVPLTGIPTGRSGSCFWWKGRVSAPSPYLELEEPGPPRDDLEVQHKSLTAYDELLQEGEKNLEPEPM